MLTIMAPFLVLELFVQISIYPPSI